MNKGTRHTEETRELQRAAQRATWADPAIRARKIAAITAAHNTPAKLEQRAARAARMREARRLTPEERAERVRVRQLRVFYSHVTPGPDGHLLWTGARFVGRDGQPTYGMSHYGGDTHTAHSAVWRIEVGEIPTGWDVDHDEGCPKNCVNVAHLSLLSHSVHGRKSWARGLERKRQKARMRLLAKFAVGLVKIEEDG